MEIENNINNNEIHTVQAKFISENGDEAGAPLDLPIGITTTQLALICNAILQNV